ncbi:MAG: YidC/Oxa1 family insertase periplasmic-domain containing protein [Pirellulaceae bacterium]
MEKRFLAFIMLTMLIIVGYQVLLTQFGPPRPDAGAGKQVADKQGADKQGANQEVNDPPGAEKQNAGAGKDGAKKVVPEKQAAGNQAAGNQEPGKQEVGPQGEQPEGSPSPAEEKAQADVPHRVVSLGSYESQGGSPLLVTLNSRGATLERVELVGRTAKGDLQYRDLDGSGGYLGNMSLVPEVPSGCRVEVVPAGTPAAQAGLTPGDLLLQIGGERVASKADADAILAKTKPGDKVQLTVERETGGRPEAVQLSATLAVRPLELIGPESTYSDVRRLSLRLAVGASSGDKSTFLQAMNDEEWEVVAAETTENAAAFRYTVSAARAAEFGLSGPVEVIKRYRLGAAPTPEASGQGAGRGVPPYHIDFRIEIRNLLGEPQKLAYRLDGTQGLPTEGWWYSAKIHPGMFQGAGARDVVVSTAQGGSRLIGCPALVSRAKGEERNPELALFGENEAIGRRSVEYIGVDTQYFAAVLVPAGAKAGEAVAFSRGEAMVLSDVSRIPKGWERTANVSFQLTSPTLEIDPSETFQQDFVLFAGPKVPEVVEAYHLGDLIYYGWFGAVSRLLSTILHFFHDRLVGNYAIAIIMLTVLVRGCMFPLSRKAAKNAAMMQELAPEMKKIAEKYKSNMEARGKAQQELFRKHNYNPLSGCWMMFVQLPVFIGLYRCLAVDIKLRQAPLIAGVEWASNLAGPDKLFYWKAPWLAFLTDESGWLGPYFNLLPIFTIGLFLVHQQLFTPPATDEQTAMQLKMMKFMTIFMGVLFYKVPAGLCIYFIASSLWGIAERKLMPKPTVNKSSPGDEGGGRTGWVNPFAPKTDGNGTSPRKRPQRRPPKPKA